MPFTNITNIPEHLIRTFLELQIIIKVIFIEIILNSFAEFTENNFNKSILK